MDDLSVIIPTLNEPHGSLKKIQKSLEALGAEVIVVDDGSEKPYPTAIKHGVNFGYGSALLTGIKNATRPTILTMDGDGQHRVQDVKNLYKVWNMIDVDMIIGVRRLKGEKWFRYLGRKFLNTVASLLATYWLPDLNSGLRIVKASIVKGYAPILCRSFSFTTSLTLSMLLDGYRLEWFPIVVQKRKSGSSRVRVFQHGFVTLWYILKIGIALRTRGLRKCVRSLPLIGRNGSREPSPKKNGETAKV